MSMSLRFRLPWTRRKHKMTELRLLKWMLFTVFNSFNLRALSNDTIIVFPCIPSVEFAYCGNSGTFRRVVISASIDHAQNWVIDSLVLFSHGHPQKLGMNSEDEHGYCWRLCFVSQLHWTRPPGFELASFPPYLNMQSLLGSQTTVTYLMVKVYLLFLHGSLRKQMKYLSLLWETAWHLNVMDFIWVCSITMNSVWFFGQSAKE